MNGPGPTMDDDAADVGLVSPERGLPELDPPPNKVALDLEFSLFYDAEMPRLVAFLMVRGVRANIAPDIAQEALTEAYRSWSAIDNHRAWARTVALRLWQRRLKYLTTELPCEELHDDQLLALDDADEIENRHIFLELLKELSDIQREVMAWTYDGYTPNEIALYMKKSPATVRSTLRNARAIYRSRYKEDPATS